MLSSGGLVSGFKIFIILLLSAFVITFNDRFHFRVENTRLVTTRKNTIFIHWQAHTRIPVSTCEFLKCNNRQLVMQ